MRPAAILESPIYARDLDAAGAFYGEVLGLEEIARVQGRHIFYRCGQAVLLVFNPDETVHAPHENARLPVPPHDARGEGHLCFAAAADEIERWKTRLMEAGIEIEADFEWPQGGRSIYFRDPAGNSLEFAEPRIWRL